MSDTENKSELSWLARVVVLVVPVVGSLLEHESVKANPWLLLLILPAWALMYVVARIATRVWERIEPNIVDECHERLLTRLNQSAKNWNDQITYRHRDFDVKGIATQGPFTLDLMQVYVDLRIVATPLHSVPVDPLPEPLAAGSVSSAELDLWPALVAHKKLAILGTPGSGKTTLLKHCALMLAGPPSTRAIARAPNSTPILLFLREFASQISDQSFTLVEAAKRASMSSIPFDGPWLQRRLRNGDCVVMLDGLDEIPDTSVRAQMSRWVEAQVVTYPGNYWLVSSRPFGYQSCPLTGFTVLAVQPLKRSQIERFLHQWYLANEIKASQRRDPGVEDTAKMGAKDLLNRLDRTPELTRLAVNPLLLTLIASVHRFRSSLPGRRVELYSEICEVFLGRRQEARGVSSDLTPLQKKLVLQHLAWQMMVTGRREIPNQDATDVIREPLERVQPNGNPVDFLRMVERGSGLLIERESGIWSFTHKTFQEYLAAVHAKERNLGADLSSKVGDQWWHEAIRLYVAQGDASDIIAACMLGEPPPVASLLLAIQCAEEGREVAPQIRRELLEIIDSQLESENDQRRRLAAECRLELRLRELPRFDDQTFGEFAFITNAEYQLFVDSEAASGRIRAPDHWSGMQFDTGTARDPILGVRGVDALAFCDWLTHRDGGDWRYRPPLEEEVKEDLDEAGGDVGVWIVDEDSDPMVLRANTSASKSQLLQLENALSGDLQRLLDCSDEERAALCFGITDDEIRALQRLLRWTLHGELRLFLRLMKSALEWPTTWWWRCAGWMMRAIRTAMDAMIWSIGWIFRPVDWIASQVLLPEDADLRKQRIEAFSAAAYSFGRRIGPVLHFLFRPVIWPFEVWFVRNLRNRLEKERIKLALDYRNRNPGDPSQDLDLILAESLQSKEAFARSLGDFTVLFMLATLFELFEAVDSMPGLCGKVTIEAGNDPDVPAEISKYARLFAARTWHVPSGEQSSMIDSFWAIRTQILLHWRRESAAVFAEMVQSKRNVIGPKMWGDSSLRLLDLWFEVWAIESRISGRDAPFEGIVVVKERRHRD